jgi:hypothetical protein
MPEKVPAFFAEATAPGPSLPTDYKPVRPEGFDVAREIRPDLELAVCLEDQVVWKAINAEAGLGRCNCVL